jgi:hypothetical protein
VASKPGIANSYKLGDPILYPEFNSNVIPRLGTRRYRLYQVAAVRNTKMLYPNVTIAEFKEYARKYKLEASHNCKLRKPLSYQEIDGTRREVEMFEENKACFFEGHLIMEPDYINRSRIKCDGRGGCDHSPKCIVTG